MHRPNLAPEDPQRLGEYWVASRLGAGGQGVVYEAYDKDGSRVALKVLRRDVASGPEARAQFAKEARAARRVASFCTAKVLAADPDAESPYIVSEFVAGADLRSAVHSSGPFTGDDLLRLAIGVATALTAIHRADVVHRDLKPANVLLGPDGPRVIDFGIARTPEMTLTEPGSTKGTFGYIAPEALFGQRVTAAADVFAWGAVVLFAATGCEPFRGENIGEVVVKALEHEPDVEVLPPSLRPLVRKALAKQPEDRPSAAAVLLSLLGTEEQADDQAVLEAGASTAARVRVPIEAATARVPALGEVATSVYGALSPAAQAVAHEIWLRLVVPGRAPDGSQDTVRTASEEELLSGRPEAERLAVHEAITAFAAAGVLVHEPTGVRPPGPAVLRAWQRLREWVEADHDGLRIHRQVGEAAGAWEQHGQRADDLYHGTALRHALGWAATSPKPLRLNLLERQFLDASRAADARRARRRRTLLACTSLLVVLALVAGAIAWQQNRAGERQRVLAEARRLASIANSMRFEDPVTAMRLSLAAWRIADVTETRSALLSAMVQKEADTFRAPSHDWPRLSGDGRTLLTVDKDRVVRWDVVGHRRTDSVTVPALDAGHVRAVSDDGRIIAVESTRADGSVGDARIWDLGRRQPIGKAIDWRLGIVQFSPSGRLLVLHDDERHTIRLWDIRRQRTLFEHPAPIDVVTESLSLDDRLMAVCSINRPLELWDIRHGVRVGTSWAPASRQKSCNSSHITFSPDSRTMAVVSEDSVRMWDIASGKMRQLRHASVESAAFSEDGRFVVTAGNDEILVWRMSAASRPVYRHPLVNERPSQVRIDIDARKIRYLSGAEPAPEVSVRTLDLGLAVSPDWRKTALNAAVFGPHARHLGVAWKDGRTLRIEMRDGRSGKVTADLPDTPLPMDGSDAMHAPKPMTFSPDGEFLAYGVREARVWDTASSHVTFSFRFGEDTAIGPDPVRGMALDPGGERLALSHMAKQGEIIDIWDIRRRVKLKTLPRTGGANLAFRPDGRLLVTSGRVVSLPSGKSVQGVLSQQGIAAIAFSPDRKRLAIGDYSGRVTLWDGDARRRLGVLSGTYTGPRRGDTEAVTTVAFSADGRTLATGGDKGTLQLWDVASNQQLGLALPTPGDKILSLAFSTDGDTLYAAGSHNQHQQYTLDPQYMSAFVCKRTGGNLSRKDWRTYIPHLPYRTIC
ncbi:WD40 repeat protein [Streptomyces umbrinus]|uniref:WD40 repeat protein n=1 Tax=Streptomyces umbrinus TaxID=67370 RepID=A0ABU0T963_9ACTN|nr:WD40 repeat domain-containing serine/threonine protein kinase [Streptomyces umbrinus]MDQ1031359.1 WD40 repeat protein [Streptomyces umbrinus]